MLVSPHLATRVGMVVAMPRDAHIRARLGWRTCVAAAMLMVLAGAPASRADDSQGALISPVEGVRVVRLFDPPPQPWHAGHRGIDLAAPVGAPVLSPGAGVVTFAGEVVDRGVVTVTHPNGLRSSLEPVSVSVEVGQRVAAGQQLGTVADGSHHCGDSACVHWGLRDGTRYLNPLDWLVGFGPVRLLPLKRTATRRLRSSSRTLAAS